MERERRWRRLYCMSTIQPSGPRATPAPLRFEPHFEVPERDEARTTTDMNAIFHKIQQKVFEDTGHAYRGVHAKSHGILRGELHVAPNLPTALAQGVFAKCHTYPLVMRLSTVPGDILDDAVSTPRAIALKIIGVEGARLPSSENDITQDFIFVNGPAFGAPTAHAFAKNLKLVAATTDKAPGLKKMLSAVFRGAEKVSEALGHESSTLLSLGGHPETNPLGDTYYSQTPFLYGDYAVKLSLAPVSPALVALKKAPVDLKGKPNGLREALLAHFAVQGGDWELRVQFCTDLKTMPIEDASKVWPEDVSPFITVGRIRVDSQTAWSPARSAAVDDGMAFNPWHGLAAHRPLGSVNRVRKMVYETAARFRAERDGVSVAEPRNLDNFPKE
jgi:hypothetical protein